MLRNLWMERNQSFCIAAFTRDVFTHVSCWQGRLSGLHLLGLRCNLADVPNTSSVTLSWRRIGVKCKQATSLVNFGGRPHSQLCGPLIGVGPQLRHREGFIHAYNLYDFSIKRNIGGRHSRTYKLCWRSDSIPPSKPRIPHRSSSMVQPWMMLSLGSFMSKNAIGQSSASRLL